jgi:hypothetical protein
MESTNNATLIVIIGSIHYIHAKELPTYHQLTAYVSGTGISEFFFRDDCGINIDRGPHVLQTDLSIKIYSIFWLSQNFFILQLFN